MYDYQPLTLTIPRSRTIDYNLYNEIPALSVTLRYRFKDLVCFQDFLGLESKTVKDWKEAWMN